MSEVPAASENNRNYSVPPSSAAELYFEVVCFFRLSLTVLLVLLVLIRSGRASSITVIAVLFLDMKNDQQKRLAQLVRDLETKKSLCCVRDYPGITLDDLNQYVAKHSPLANPVFGGQPAFFIDEGHFTPYRMVVYSNQKLAAKIAELIGGWAK